MRTMLAATAPLSPETRDNSGVDAVFRSTPTELTQSSITVPRLFISSLWFTSCWYWPTPMLFGSIFTSSASGSCKRRAIDTARCGTCLARFKYAQSGLERRVGKNLLLD